MLSNKNNLRSELTANVGVLATSISITAGEGVLWENNMVACLEHYENDICTKREVIKITAKNNDTFTITRGFADCIMNDQTKQQGHGSQEFVIGDYLSLYLSKEIWESLTVGITTNETAIQTMVARINAPKTCINDNCQDWKNAIDTAYVTKFGGVAGFGTGADGDVVISQDTFLDAGCEYNFNNLTILEGVTVRFQGVGTPTINVWNNFKNFGTIDLRAPYLQARTDSQTDHWLHNGTAVANQSDSLTGIASEGGLYNGGAGGGGTSAGSDASDGHGGNGGSGAPYDGINGGAGGTSGSYGTGGGGAFGMGTGGRGGNGSCGGGNGGNGFYGGRGGDVTMRSRFDGGGGAGGKGVIRGGDAGGGTGGCDYNTFGNGGDAITNVYGLHLNARNIWNNLVDASGGDGGNGGIYYWSGTSGGYAPSGGNGGNGANGGQILVSYDTIHEQGCFDVSGGKGGTGAKIGFSSESYWRYEQPNGTDGTAGWVVFRNLNNPYIQNFNLENDEDNEAILISWKDPSFKPSNPQQWAKTVVRYSTSNYPTTPTDGTLAVEETTRDQYETTPYSLTGVLDETTYYFSIFALDQNNNIIDSETSSITTDFGWHVTPNTLFYIKNNGEITDHSQYNHVMNWYGTSNFATLSNGRKVAHFNGNNGIYSNQFTEANNKTTFTLHGWWQYLGYNTDNGNVFGWSGRSKSSTSTSDRWGLGLQTVAGNDAKNTLIYGINSTSWGTVPTSSYVDVPSGTFKLFSITVNGNSFKIYINGTLTKSFTGNTIRGGSSTGPVFWLGKIFYSDGTLWNGGPLCYIGETVLEDKVQTDAEILQFYNKTKKNYV